MVCFVILHYMAIEETILCVNSIESNVVGEKKIIIVDNASPNNTFKNLKKYYADSADIDILATEKNLGFARGNNIGYKYAVKKYDPHFIVVMNNDTEVKQSDFISLIEKSFDQHKYFIMGPDIYSTKNNYHQNPQTRKIPSKEELKKNCKRLWIKDKLNILLILKWKANELIFKKNKTGKKVSKSLEYIDSVVVNPLLHGSCYIFSRLFLETHSEECFYDKTFMYMEAEILYYLAIKAGEKMIYNPEIKIDHHEDVATDAEFKKQYKKSIFSIKCLLKSNRAFLELMEQTEKSYL